MSLLGHKKTQSNKFVATVEFEFRSKRQPMNTEVEAQYEKIKAIKQIKGIT